MSDERCQFKVRNGDAPAGVSGGDKRILDFRWELEAPKKWGAERAGCAKPHAAHAALAGVRRAHEVGALGRNQFLKPGWPSAERVGNACEVGDHVPYPSCEAHAIAIRFAERILEN